MKQEYHLKVFWSNEDEGYICLCDEFRGLLTFGDTIEDALKEAGSIIPEFQELSDE